MSPRSSNAKIEINAANFPSLRSFLHGYFHEDVADEYGTPVEAAEQFCEDADPEERNAVAREWERLMQLMQGRPVAAQNEALKKLGSACRLSEEALGEVTQIFARCLTGKAIHPVVKEEEDEE